MLSIERTVSEELLQCVGKETLLRITTKTGLKPSKSGVKCDALIKSLIHKLSTQRNLFGVTLGDDPSFLIQCHSLIGDFIAISEDTAEIVSECQFLYFLDSDKSMETSILATFGRTKYPKYPLHTDIGRADLSIFPTKQIFTEYRDALRYRSTFNDLCSEWTKKKKKGDSTEILQSLKETVTTIQTLQQRQEEAHSFATRYRDIAVYGSLLHRGVVDVVEKLAEKQHVLCCEIYQQLLSSQRYLYRRGKWYCRLALLLDHHLKEHKMAYKLCGDALRDDYVEIADRNELIKRYKVSHSVSFFLFDGDSFHVIFSLIFW